MLPPFQTFAPSSYEAATRQQARDKHSCVSGPYGSELHFMVETPLTMSARQAYCEQGHRGCGHPCNLKTPACHQHRIVRDLPRAKQDQEDSLVHQILVLAPTG